MNAIALTPLLLRLFPFKSNVNVRLSERASKCASIGKNTRRKRVSVHLISCTHKFVWEFSNKRKRFEWKYCMNNILLIERLHGARKFSRSWCIWHHTSSRVDTISPPIQKQLLPNSLKHSSINYPSQRVDLFLSCPVPSCPDLFRFVESVHRAISYKHHDWPIRISTSLYQSSSFSSNWTKLCLNYNTKAILS